MTAYTIKFYKNLLSSDGRPFKVLQRIVNVRHSKSGERALKAARHRFERAEHVCEWRLHADSVELECDDENRGAGNMAAG